MIEQILDKYTPEWREEKQDSDERYRFRGVWEETQRCIALLEAREELEAHLSDRGPRLDGASLHPGCGNPRLRLPLPDGTAEKSVRAIYAGISQYCQGLFSAVRNPLAHEAPGHSGMTEVEALEALAAFSLLARWVDRSEVRRG